MTLQELNDNAKKYFPNLQIKYKDNSLLMKILGLIMFFNKDFMSTYTNTFGNTIYYPSQKYVDEHATIAQVTLLHELIHMHDYQKRGKLIYSFLYMFPQVLFLFCIPLFFFAWKLALILSIITLLPWPAYFRMTFERRGYLCSLYALNALGKKWNVSPTDIQQTLDKNKDGFAKTFSGPAYYFMWIFSSLKSDFDKGLNKIKAGMRPYDDDVFDMIDDLLSKI